MPWTAGSPPAFTLSSAGGGDVALRAQRHGAVLVHFFATWCEPCREELPALARLAARGASALRIFAISVAEPDRRVEHFVESTPVSFPVLLDRDRAVAKAWKVATLPTTFVLDAKLTPRLVAEGDYAWDKVDPAKLIDALSARHNKLTQNKEGNNVFR